ncbi:MAG: hypothetical protein A2365_01345 [Candidatus Nealsonbacteria bacterium RIFOXYB1_FULL_40_15]|uniref:Pesticidal protein Cry7Aa n=2 Tax=Candidatus Nealsoniibacteriota TaxID=1817911 RepID=A0A1G2EQN8_9BACT|nr:MAG: hypothetical protein A2365_01345 [Candidatus Nealsonbacteria bacterium RIFOXYB1_FULL_40_15]OGZ27862.1 MAG: hypothetical protein A2427_04075 [Candidatus Nealsonbacteria bacterium RIFOXYC1_FULL_40_7]OGZ28021.1 MAG: hypothetical protein A2562_01425 [Candidatus Nealsonbacteria bacterium RIFOXYD1_FULL_39_11]
MKSTIQKEDVGVEKLGVILKATENPFEKRAVLNPGCWQEKDHVHIFYRAADEHYKSTIGYAKMKGPISQAERKNIPVIDRDYDYEKKGVEDPRITKIGKTYYMTYVAYNGKSAITALAESSDLKKFKKRGIISPLLTYEYAASLFKEEMLKDRYFMFQSYYQDIAGKDVLLWFKDFLLFPKKINGKFAALARILPDIQLVCFKNFDELKSRAFWKNYLKNLYKNVVLENKYWFESRNIGGGCPPIYTKEGWLVIFHTVEDLNSARIYRASAALLDKKNPLKVIGRLNRPLFSPEEDWEKEGWIGNVVFPTGTAIFGEHLYVYYGASDNKIAVAKINMEELLEKLKNTPEK